MDRRRQGGSTWGARGGGFNWFLALIICDCCREVPLFNHVYDRCEVHGIHLLGTQNPMSSIIGWMVD